MAGTESAREENAVSSLFVIISHDGIYLDELDDIHEARTSYDILKEDYECILCQILADTRNEETKTP